MNPSAQNDPGLNQPGATVTGLPRTQTDLAGARRTGLAVMISGGGRTLLNLDDHIRAGTLPAHINVVIASSHCAGAERARARGLPVLVIPGEIPAAVLGRVLHDHSASWVVLAGYLKKVQIPLGFEGRVVNIHPALLPAFGGPGMYGERVHKAVIEAGSTISGCTVHLCDSEYDRGPIVAQASCDVKPDDTAQTLAARVFELEKALYPEALRRLIESGG